MNNQEAFSRVKNHLLAQNKRSLDVTMCAYRGRNRLKCAIGCLIPDDLYDLQMEGLGVRLLRLRYPDFGTIIDGVDITMLESLQHMHDSIDNDHWASELNRIAKTYGLDP